MSTKQHTKHADGIILYELAFRYLIYYVLLLHATHMLCVYIIC